MYFYGHASNGALVLLGRLVEVDPFVMNLAWNETSTLNFGAAIWSLITEMAHKSCIKLFSGWMSHVSLKVAFQKCCLLQGGQPCQYFLSAPPCEQKHSYSLFTNYVQWFWGNIRMSSQPKCCTWKLCMGKSFIVAQSLNSNVSKQTVGFQFCLR